MTGTDAVAGACANEDKELEIAPLSRVTTDSRSIPLYFIKYSLESVLK